MEAPTHRTETEELVVQAAEVTEVLELAVTPSEDQEQLGLRVKVITAVAEETGRVVYKDRAAAAAQAARARTTRETAAVQVA